jgi:nitrile hydratase accessory protein
LKPLESAREAIAALASVPHVDDEPDFAEPWQAKAFAMALSLHERGIFTWKEWADRLAAAVSAAQVGGDPDLGNTYYHHWLSALESVVVEKGLLEPSAIVARHAAWDRAARATPHGEPIVLGRELLAGGAT